jgi:Flp pilus assembly protein TadG
MAAGRRKSLRGQSLVEVAISLPVLLLLALGVTDIGRAFYYREAVTNSARQALRIAVSPGQHTTADAVCAGAGGPSAVTVATSIGSGGSSIGSIVNIASLESSSNGTAAGSVINGGAIAVTFHCLAGKVITNATSNGAGPLDPGSDSVTVSVTYRLNVITPLLWPVTGTSFPITVTSYQRVEY